MLSLVSYCVSIIGVVALGVSLPASCLTLSRGFSGTDFELSLLKVRVSFPASCRIAFLGQSKR